LLPPIRNSPDIAKLASYFGNAYDGMNYSGSGTAEAVSTSDRLEDEIDKLADVCVSAVS